MKIIFLFVGAAILLTAVGFWVKSRVVPNYRVSAHEIPRILAELSATESRPAFAVFLFSSPDFSNWEDHLEIQFSMEGTKPGFDWVLIGPQNVKDESRFADFARSAGYTPESREMNGVRYLRIKNGDLASLCQRVITEMYRRSEAEPIDLIVEGFDWQP